MLFLLISLACGLPPFGQADKACPDENCGGWICRRGELCKKDHTVIDGQTNSTTINTTAIDIKARAVPAGIVTGDGGGKRDWRPAGWTDPDGTISSGERL